MPELVKPFRDQGHRDATHFLHGSYAAKTERVDNDDDRGGGSISVHTRSLNHRGAGTAQTVT